MRVLDLYAGLKGWSQPFADRGHEVVTLDYLPHFNCDYTVDIMEWPYQALYNPGDFDVILASPPCEKFSTMGFQYGWFDEVWDREQGRWRIGPVKDEARHAMALVEKAVEIIRYIEPQFYVIENPKALLRKLEIIPFDLKTVWYCHYGEHRAKPTDLWGTSSIPSLELSPECHNRRESHTDPNCCCKDHIAAPRGSRTGTQGMNREVSAKIPYPLALSVCLASENDFAPDRSRRT